EMSEEKTSLEALVDAAKKIFTNSEELGKIVAEKKRLEAIELQQSSPKTNGDTTPEEATTPL
ncbi:unnamed protein product, partial [marine sediment metagenome]